jgi:hypothetical protein
MHIFSNKQRIVKGMYYIEVTTASGIINSVMLTASGIINSVMFTADLKIIQRQRAAQTYLPYLFK